MKKASLLYFLKDRRGPYRKIGLAVDVGRRIGQLPDDIDRGASYVVECFKRASDVERSLHHLFSEFRITKEHGGDGHTEWFAEDCFDAIRRFIEENRSILGVGPFSPLSDEPPRKTETLDPRHVQRRRRVSWSEYAEDRRKCLEDNKETVLQGAREFFGSYGLLKWPTGKPDEWGVVVDVDPLSLNGNVRVIYDGNLGWPGLSISTLLSIVRWCSFPVDDGSTYYSCLVRTYEERCPDLKDYVAAIEQILSAIPTVDARPEGVPDLDWGRF